MVLQVRVECHLRIDPHQTCKETQSAVPQEVLDQWVFHLDKVNHLFALLAQVLLEVLKVLEIYLETQVLVLSQSNDL